MAVSGNDERRPFSFREELARRARGAQGNDPGGLLGAGNPLEALLSMFGQNAQGGPSSIGAPGMENDILNLLSQTQDSRSPGSSGPLQLGGNTLDFTTRGEGSDFLENFLGQPQEPVDPNQALLEQLAGYNQDLQGLIGTGAESLEAAIKQATGGINKSYGSAINLLRQQNQGARADTREGSKEIRQMYAALRKDYKNTAKQEKRAGEKMARSLEQAGANQAANVNRSASDLLSQNAAAAEGLGSPDIAAALNAQVAKKSQAQGEQAISRASNEANRERSLAEGQRGYFNRTGSHVNLEGTNRAADLFSQLQDYLQGNRAKIGDIAGQRATALAQAQASIRGSHDDNSAQITQQVFDNALKMAELKMAIEGQRAEAQQGQSEQGIDLSKYLPEQTLNPDMILSGAGDRVQSLFPQMLDNNSIVQNNYMGTGQELSGNMPLMTKYLKEYLSSDRNDTGVNWNELSEQERSMLLSALLASMGGQPRFQEVDDGSL